MMTAATKPLGGDLYGSIPHLPGSRVGPGDHTITPQQADLFLVDTRSKTRRVIVQEKLDGSCCGVARIGDQIIPLGRKGYPAITSPYEQHRLFHDWAMERVEDFLCILEDGERIIGEWLAQAHGTRYDLGGFDPWVAFDIMRGTTRLPYRAFGERVHNRCDFAQCFATDGEALPIETALQILGDRGYYGADRAEGLVYRLEDVEKRAPKDGPRRVVMLAKYVRPDKIDGCHLPEITGGEPVWNWRPEVGDGDA